MSKKKVIVTGGAGFIGSHMVDLLISENYSVIVIDNLSGGHLKNINHHKNNKDLFLYEKDINKISIDDKIFKEVEFIFHFAGIGDIVPSIEKPYEYMNTNIIGTVNILEGARYNKINKFLYAASSSCYGIAKTPTDENHKIFPMYPYALSKYLGEQSIMHWNKVYNLPVISIRIFNAYGQRVRTTGVYGAVFGVFFKQKIENKPFTIVGDGEQSRDFIYVTDICKAFYQSAISNYNCEIFNLGEGKPKKINYLVQLLGKNEIKYITDRPGEPKITHANINKIKNMIDWKPEINFEKGVNLMLENINEWKDAPLWDVDSINKATYEWFKYMNKNKKNL